MSVYIACLPTRYDSATDQRIPTVDLNAAAAYGPIIAICTGPIPAENCQLQLKHLRSQLHDFTEDDFLVSVGDAVFTGAAISQLVAQNGGVNVLRWDRSAGAYDTIYIENDI